MNLSRRLCELGLWVTLMAIGVVTGAQAVPSEPTGECMARPEPEGGSSTAPVAAQVDSIPAHRRTFAFYLDEDNLQHFARHTDRNYTLGTGFVWGGDRPRHFQDAALVFFDWAIGRRIGSLFDRELKDSLIDIRFTRRLEAGAFSPESIGTANIQYGDRPWAMLVAWTARRDEPRLRPGGAVVVWSAEATVGTIGSPVGKVVQRSIHSIGRTLSGSNRPLDPAGWGNQIMNSRFGVPTARVKLERTEVLAPQRWRIRESAFLDALGTPPVRVELLWRASGELGYYTDLSLGGQLRFGWIRTASWEHDSEPSSAVSRGGRRVGDFSGLPAMQRFFGQIEVYAFGGAEGYVYGYNAMIQGYGDFWSRYRMSGDQLERATLNGRAGLAVGWRSLDKFGQHHALQVSYTPEAFRTREFKGPLARAHHWAGLRLVVSEALPGCPRE